MKKSIFLFLVPILLTLACVSAEKALDKGNYKDAVWKALSKLKKSPKDSKSRKTLKQAYPLFVDKYKEDIEQIADKRDPLRWEDALKKYETLEEAYQKIRNIPTARKAVDAMSFSREIYEVKEKVLEARYNLGEELLATGDRDDARKAYDHFEYILRKQDVYKDTNLKLEEAKDAATIFVAIAPIPTPSYRLESSIVAFENELTEQLRDKNNDDFIRFVDPGNRYNIPLEEIDHVIEMRFYDFNMGNTQDREQTFTRTRDDVATTEVKIGDSTVVTPIIVEAEVYCFTREIRSSGRLELEIIDNSNGRREERERFDATHTYTDTWGYFEGDSRALDPADRNCMERRSAPPLPREEELFTEVSLPLFDQTIDYLERYYRRY